jgi:hypothetical protein
VVANIDSVCVLSEFDFKVLKNLKGVEFMLCQ